MVKVDSPMSALPSDLSVDELARRCRQEAERFLAGRPHNEAYGLELFRRAIINRDQAAWQAIYAQYQALVARWVRHHAKFQSTNEEAVFFVNGAFARFWHAVSKQERGLQFDSLASLLGYLKRCVHSAIEDECRRQQRWPQDALAWDDLSEAVADDIPSPEARVIGQVVADTIEWAVMSRLQGEEEEVTAALSWTYGLRPRQIQVRRPDLFPNVRRIYEVKRNIVSRLLRDPEIQQLRRHMHQKCARLRCLL
jgi:DNA-directed RNA polymerase specialized sigma24 family protein